MIKKDELVGKRFNLLTVLEELPVSPNGRILRCKCDCGNVKDILRRYVVSSKSKSCGCYHKTAPMKHGMRYTREYRSWDSMIQRCTNPRHKKYYLYGERGITICDRWLESFKEFYKDMGPRPKNTSLDRIDGDKGYYKENCRWSNPREQSVNVRVFNQFIKHDNVFKTTDDWLNELNIDRDLFKSRVLRGLNFKEAIFSDVSIRILNVDTDEEVIYQLPRFLEITGFEKEKVLELLDNDHEEPYFGLLIRYLTDFDGWYNE